MRRSPVLVAAALTALTFAIRPAEAAPLVQPGAYMQSGNLACTLGFVFDGQGPLAGQVFLGTAAHCVASVGDAVQDEDGNAWGDVAFRGNDGVNADDFAFVKVRAAARDRVNPGVKGYPQYPTGVTTPGDTNFGDQVQISGYGIGYDMTQPTREWRFAFMGSDDESTWSVSGPLINGDSGGPLVHIPTGKALGIESRVCIGVCTDTGPTVQGMLARASAAGFPVRLRTI